MITDNSYYHRHLPHYQPESATFFATFRLAGSLPRSVIEQLQNERENHKRTLMNYTDPGERKILLRKIQDGYFERFDSLLNGKAYGPHWLQQPEVASIVKEAIHFRDRKEYTLLAYCIMPNHVHQVFSLEEGTDEISIDSILIARKTSTGQTWFGRATDFSSSAPVCLQLGQDNMPSYRVTRILGSLKKYSALKANKVLGRKGAFWQDESYDHVIRDGAELERIILYVLNNPVMALLVDTWERWPWSYCARGILNED